MEVDTEMVDADGAMLQQPQHESNIGVDDEHTQSLANFPILNLDVPYGRKWDILKPVLENLYLVEGHKINHVAQTMKDVYGFHAVESQYKGQFRKWKWKKNVPKHKKEAMLGILQSRATAGESAATFRYRGKVVDSDKLRRQMKAGMREELLQQIALGLSTAILDTRTLAGNALTFGNTVFLAFNLPYRSMRFAGERSVQLVKGSPPSQITPSDVSIITPSPHFTSPANQVSPMTQARNAQQTIERTNMFISGQNFALAKTLSKSENRTLSNWRYQFWFFAFKSAKHWSRGPAQWTWETLCSDLEQLNIHAQTPDASGPSSRQPIRSNVLSPDSISTQSPISAVNVQIPQLCRWSVHLDDDTVDFEEYDSDSNSEENDFNPSDQRSWRTWSRKRTRRPFEDIIRRGLKDNSFAKPGTGAPPIELQRVADASENSQCRFLSEALGFAIIARNEILVRTLCGRLWFELQRANAQFHDFFPLHVAAVYLDGSKECCNIMNNVLQNLERWGPKVYRNHLDHTVLDGLMLKVISSHTSLTPGSVDEKLRGENRFPGEEVDVCGRWDADSGSYRTLISAGVPSIPWEWKHKFCHTSAQAVCHCITLLRERSSRFIQEESGIFIKRCTYCGLHMTLSTLHTVVVVCFNLLQHGTDDEDLFGCIAVLLSLLHNGADPRLKRELSPSEIFGHSQMLSDESERCTHIALSPFELLESVPTVLKEQWPASKQNGWESIRNVLLVAEMTFADTSNEMHEDFDVDDNIFRCLDCNNSAELRLHFNRNLSVLWNTVQAELLTYRRQTEDDPWQSNNFSMEDFQRTIHSLDDLSAGPLTNQNLMKATCDTCWNFRIWSKREWPAFPRASEVMTAYFSNLGDNWQLMSAIEQPGIYSDRV